jgi:hypothetical protein
MYVQYDTEDLPPPRQHPWTRAENGPEAKYYNFVDRPDLIPIVLEDFKLFADQDAVQRFYALLRWLNGLSSPFETNDCGLRAPRIDHEVPDLIAPLYQSDPMMLHGRLTVFFRKLDNNAIRTNINWLKQAIHDALRDQVPPFPALINVGTWPHWFNAIDKAGNVISLRFWAWGDDETQAFQNLGGIYQTLNDLFQWLAGVLKKPPQG